MTKRRMPAPWSVVETDESFIIQDASGFPRAYVYFARDRSRAEAARRMTREEAGAVALNIAKLPMLLEKDKGNG